MTCDSITYSAVRDVSASACRVYRSSFRGTKGPLLVLRTSLNRSVDLALETNNFISPATSEQSHLNGGR